MNIAITFRQMETTEAVKSYATEKVAKIQKFLRKPLEGQVTLSCQQNRLHTVELDVSAGQDRFHASETTEDMYASVDKTMDKLERQIRSHKSSKKGSDRASDYILPDISEDKAP